MDGLVGNQKEEAPIYLGGKDDKFPFIDNQYDRKRDRLDDNVMDAVIACCVGDKECPRNGQYIHSAITYSMLSVITEIVAPLFTGRGASLKDVEMLSWDQLWRFFRDYPKRKKTDKRYERLNEKLVDSLLRLLIPRQHWGAPPLEGPYIESYFVGRWSSSFNCFPDSLSDKICNVRKRRLDTGKAVMEILPKEFQDGITLMAKYTPEILEYLVKKLTETESA